MLLNREELLDALDAKRKECHLENERIGFDIAYSVVESMGTEPDVEQEKRKRAEQLFNNALNWIHENVGYDDEEYLRVCRHALRMNDAEIAEEKHITGYE